MKKPDIIKCPICEEEKEFYHRVTLSELPFEFVFHFNICEDCVKALRRNPEVLKDSDPFGLKKSKERKENGK